MSEAERRQAAYDALLTWCSELGSGTYEQFRRGSTGLRLGASAAARVLSVLGHVEFCWRTRRFSCAPATLTTIAGMPGRFLLCGQRPLRELVGEAEYAVVLARLGLQGRKVEPQLLPLFFFDLHLPLLAVLLQNAEKELGIGREEAEIKEVCDLVPVDGDQRVTGLQVKLGCDAVLVY